MNEFEAKQQSIFVDLATAETTEQQPIINHETNNQTSGNFLTKFHNWLTFGGNYSFSRCKALSRLLILTGMLAVILPLGATCDTFFDNAIINPDINFFDFIKRINGKYLGFASGQMFSNVAFDVLAIPVVTIWFYKIAEIIRGQIMSANSETNSEQLLSAQSDTISDLKQQITELVQQQTSMQLTINQQQVLIEKLIEATSCQQPAQTANAETSIAWTNFDA